MVEGRGRRLDVPTAFADDDGSADPQLASTMRACAAGQCPVDDVIALLCAGVRLLVPIVAVLDEMGEDGEDKSSHMASVSLLQADGRRGILAFTSLDALRAWDPTARPVPAAAPDVAAAALAEGAQGVLIDVAGPIRLPVDGDHLSRLAAAAPGHRPG